MTAGGEIDRKGQTKLKSVAQRGVQKSAQTAFTDEHMLSKQEKHRKTIDEQARQFAVSECI